MLDHAHNQGMRDPETRLRVFRRIADSFRMMQPEDKGQCQWCNNSQVQVLRRCLPLQDLTAHFGQLLCFGLDARECEQLPVTTMLTLEAQHATTIPKSDIAKYNSGTYAELQKPYARLRAEDLLRSTLSTCIGGEKICWQHGDLKLQHAEEECERFLVALNRWNTVAWPVHQDDTHAVETLTFSHPGPGVQAKRCDCQLFLRSFGLCIKDGPERVGGSHVHAKQRSHVHANNLWETSHVHAGQVRNYTRIGDVHFLLVKYNENRNLWYMCCFYLQPCVEVGLSRLSVRPWSQLHANRKRL